MSSPHEFQTLLRLKDAIRAQPDMELVATSMSRGISLLLEVQEKRPDVVVIASTNARLPGECSHLLSEFPSVRIVAVPPDDAPPMLAARAEELTQVLIETIRATVPQRRTWE